MFASVTRTILMSPLFVAFQSPIFSGEAPILAAETPIKLDAHQTQKSALKGSRKALPPYTS